MSQSATAGERGGVAASDRANPRNLFFSKFFNRLFLIILIVSVGVFQPVFGQEDEDVPKGLEHPLEDVSFNDPISDVAELLSAISGININVAATVDKKTNITLNVVTKKPLKQVLDEIGAQYNLWIQYKEGGKDVVIRPKSEEPQKQDLILERTFPVRFNRPSEMVELVENFLSDREGASALALDAQKIILVRDIAEALARIEEFLTRIDIPKQSVVFPIRYSDPEEILDLILERLPDLEEGAITVDIANSQLIVRTTLENLAEIQLLIETLDIKREIRVFTVSFHEPDEIIGVLEDLNLLSEEATIVANEYNGKLIIQETSDRMERIGQAIRAYDTPRPSAFIEAEILDINSSYNIGWSPTLDLEDSAVEGTVITDASGNVTSSGIVDGQTLINLAGQSAFDFTHLDAGKYLARLQASENESDVITISSPRVIVERGETANLTVGSEEPIGVRSFSNNNFGNVGNQRDIVTQRVRPVGIRLIIDALNISPKGYVELIIGLENSSVPPDGRIDIGGGTTGLRVLTSNIETTAIIKDNRTLAIGGLVTRDRSESSGGTPFINKVPFVRYFFSNLARADTKRKLVLFITPHILDVDSPLRKYEQDEEGLNRGWEAFEEEDELVTGFEEDSSVASDEQWITQDGRWGFLDENGQFNDRNDLFQGAYEAEPDQYAGKDVQITDIEARGERPDLSEPSEAARLLRELDELGLEGGVQIDVPPLEQPAPAQGGLETPLEEIHFNDEPVIEKPAAPKSPPAESEKTEQKEKPAKVDLKGKAAMDALINTQATGGAFKGTLKNLLRQTRKETGVRFGSPGTEVKSKLEEQIEVQTDGKSYNKVIREALDQLDLRYQGRPGKVPRILLKRSEPEAPPVKESEPQPGPQTRFLEPPGDPWLAPPSASAPPVDAWGIGYAQPQVQETPTSNAPWLANPSRQTSPDPMSRGVRTQPGLTEDEWSAISSKSSSVIQDQERVMQHHGSTPMRQAPPPEAWEVPLQVGESVPRPLGKRLPRNGVREAPRWRQSSAPSVREVWTSSGETQPVAMILPMDAE